MANPKQFMIKELQDRGLIRIKVFVPYYISSIGAHMFNLSNLSREEEDHPRDAILYMHGKPFNCRLHIMFVAPPGFMKTTIIEHFIRERQALLYNSCVDGQWEGFMTEAGFVGSVKEIDGMKVPKPGVALRHKNSIIGMEEFAILSTIMQSGSYGGTLIDQLLTALDSGNVAKSLGPGDLKYRTNCTIWPGTQVQRFDLGSGLPRRFIFMIWFPTKRDQEDLKDAWWDGFNVKWNEFAVRRIAREMTRVNLKIDRLEEGAVTYKPEVKELIRQTGAPHYEFPLFVRFLIGDMIMSDEFNDKLVLDLKHGRKELIMREVKWRDQIRYDAQMAQIRSILRQNDFRMSRTQLLSDLSILGVDRIEGIKTIENMIKYKILKREKDGMIIIPEDESWKGK